MRPKERDYEREHAVKVEEERAAEQEGRVRQTNQGGYRFAWDEDPRTLWLMVQIPRHLDSSLVDVDVQTRYVSIVVKGKTLRLETPEEVRPDAGKAERSTTTGELKLTLPKAKARDAAGFESRYEAGGYDYAVGGRRSRAGTDAGTAPPPAPPPARRSRLQMLLEEAAASARGGGRAGRAGGSRCAAS